MRNVFLLRTLGIYPLLALMTVMFGSLPSHAEEFVYELDAVRDVDLSAGIDLDLRCGDTDSLRVEADSEDAFEFSNREGSLRLSRARQGWFSSLFDSAGPISAYVVVRSLPKSFDVSSGAIAHITDCEINRGDVAADISSGSRMRMVDMDGDIRRLSVRASSGAGFAMNGKLDLQQADLTVSSGGSVSLADDVNVQELIVGISSGAFIDACGAREAVSGRISSGGGLSVGADAKIQGLESSSGGHVRTDC
ncbi:MAG: hypothetical protein CMP86_08425 [Gammaproteobacteria bacterium]|jgi:hypothetical protein|nr:hypothetical protein [Gammaproteobacteria bacterium]